VASSWEIIFRDVYPMPLTASSVPAAALSRAIRWGKKWGKVPHGFQPIST
jgi:hypothetical protein